ncbi:MAG: helix-turn-helix transcriptional regulator [Lachnospiraceae bacterium]|jgi:transcriptional regulator with XRE-family HTH domain|nr:helix-turn-helix transcriptional regulator [Lachnospiraceae bacterium]MCI8995347.1 helix-turn-helix transcriptional regulator [Lachnospiraceae bacterium]
MRRKNTQVDTKRTGENIENFMRQAEITVSDFARELDVTDNAVRNYIKGFNLPDTVKMYLICKLLNVDIRDIIVEFCGE